MRGMRGPLGRHAALSSQTVRRLLLMRFSRRSRRSSLLLGVQAVLALPAIEVDLLIQCRSDSVATPSSPEIVARDWPDERCRRTASSRNSRGYGLVDFATWTSSVWLRHTLSGSPRRRVNFTDTVRELTEQRPSTDACEDAI